MDYKSLLYKSCCFWGFMEVNVSWSASVDENQKLSSTIFI